MKIGLSINSVIEPAYKLDDFDLNISDDGILEPILDEPEVILTLVSQRSYIDGGSTPTSLTLLVSESIPLNSKQHLVVEKVLSDILS